MSRRFHYTGMTLIELMVVVAIVAILASLAAYFVTGSKNSNAQKDLYNELGALFQAQRTRASSMSVATYIVFHGGANVTSIEPRIGNSNICIQGNEQERFPILYYTGSTPVAIDLAGIGSTRTTESERSNKYKFNSTTLVQAKVQSFGVNNVGVDATSNPVVCFQPNGQVTFMNDNGIQQWAGFRVTIDDDKSAGRYFVEVSGLGFVRMYSQAK